jgi:hypothetical protein
MKSLVLAVTNGRMVHFLKGLSKMDLEMGKANILMIRKELSIKANGLMGCVMVKVSLLIKTDQYMKASGTQA